MSPQKQTIKMFSPELQKEAEHTLDIDTNGEIVLTCVETKRFVKFPAGTSAEAMKAQMEAYKNANKGKISLASIEAKRAELLEGLKA